LIQTKVFVRLIEMAGRRECPVADCQYGLDQTGNSGGTVQMADIALDRAKPDRMRWPCIGLCINLVQCGDLYRVAKGCCGAVAFDKADGGWIDLGVVKGRLDGFCLTIDT